MTTTALSTLTSSILLTLALGSCGLKDVGTHAEPTKFLKATGVDPSQRVGRLPFEHSWRDPNADLAKYKYIVVRPITTAFLRNERWEESKSTTIPNKRAYLKRCNALARYWDRSLQKAFSSPVCMFYKTPDSQQPGTLILEVALTEVRFDSATATAVGTPLPAGSVVSVLTGAPQCAFESRTRDAATGKLVTTAADRRGPDIKVLDASKTSFSKPNEQICDEWSTQLMQRFNKELFPTVRRSWFSLF